MAYTKKQTLKYVFSEKHKEYIRRCVSCEFNVAEGAVRAGKTVDNVYAFAHELKIAPDRIHLATGSTVGNAKLNIGDCNGLGLEYILPRTMPLGGSTKTTKLCTSKVRQPDSSRRSLSLPERLRRTASKRSEAIHMACGLQLRSTCITTARSKRH
mgnify:CR=1 FL=1